MTAIGFASILYFFKLAFPNLLFSRYRCLVNFGYSGFSYNGHLIHQFRKGWIFCILTLEMVCSFHLEKHSNIKEGNKEMCGPLKLLKKKSLLLLQLFYNSAGFSHRLNCLINKQKRNS